MPFTPSPDISLGILLMVFSFYSLAGGAAFLLVCFIEAIILWLLEWGSFPRSLRDSAMANLVTTIIGVYLYIYYPYRGWLDIFDETRIVSNMFVLWALSTIVESVVLHIIKKKSFERAILTSTAINVCSYILLYLLISIYILNG